MMFEISEREQLALALRGEHLGMYRAKPRSIRIRAYNALKRARLDTVEDILNCPYDLIKVRNLGQKSIEEIKEKIEKYKGE